VDHLRHDPPTFLTPTRDSIDLTIPNRRIHAVAVSSPDLVDGRECRWGVRAGIRPTVRTRVGAGTLAVVRVEGFVVVAGVPGSGKTTLARALAPELDLPLISKDTNKEALFDALGTGDLAWSQQLGHASHRVMYAIAADAGAAVLESHFHHGASEQDLIKLGAKLFQVYCRCPIEIAVQRYFDRAASPDRHRGHRPEHQTEEAIAGWRLNEPQPLGLDAPLIEVNTITPVDAVALAEEIRRQRSS
jgi:predicted kinase